MNFEIRQEEKNDFEQVREVIRSAFADVEISDKTEHVLVEKLRTSNAFVPELSLVAVDAAVGNIIGHILFTKAKIGQATSLALAPLSVLPEFQNRGIGGALIVRGLDEAKKLGFSSVVVLGHPRYYPRFGFEKASKWGIKSPWNVPDEVFMAMELEEGSLDSASGIAGYAEEFHEK